MHVLVTRTGTDAREMKPRLEAMGCRVTLAPLIDIGHAPVAADAVKGAAALIATSGNAIAALAASPAMPSAHSIPLYAVGAATALRAKKAGFQIVITGPGTAAELAPIIAGDPAAQDGRFIHLAGDHLAADLAGQLQATGVNIQTLVVYRSIAATALPAAVVADLKERTIDAVILMSPRTAKTWRALAGPPARNFDLDRMVHICLSDMVAKGLGGPGWRPKIEVASAPNVEEIYATIERLASRSAPR